MIASLIGLVFAGLWLSVGVTAAPEPWRTITGAVGALLLIAAILRARRGRVRGGRFAWRWYVGAVVAEVVAIMLAQNWLVAHHRMDLIFPAVGVIVGVHFLGLWKAMGLRRFIALAGALVAINLAALLVPMAPADRLMLSGFGSAAALLLSVAA